ncbi:MAG: hypothetical protein KAI83_12005 [Thiomargarita sp.]|nr:hypothetical protein [Thiomargarita sp.]
MEYREDHKKHIWKKGKEHFHFDSRGCLKNKCGLSPILFSDGDITNIWDTFYHQDDDNFSDYVDAWVARGHPTDGPDGCLTQNTINY